MENKLKGMKGERDQGSPRNHLSREQELIDKVLSAFDMGDVNALVILEKHDKQMSIMSNGISGKALLAFLVDLLMKVPEFHKTIIDIINDMKADMEVTRSISTIH